MEDARLKEKEVVHAWEARGDYSHPVGRSLKCGVNPRSLRSSFTLGNEQF